jgi:hypothetical protein
MEIILLSVLTSTFEWSDSGVSVFDPDCEDITTPCKVGNCSYEKHLWRFEFSLERLTLSVKTLRRFDTSGTAHSIKSMTSQNTRIFIGLLHPEEGASITFRNAGSCLPTDIASHVRRSVPSVSASYGKARCTGAAHNSLHVSHDVGM